MSASLLTRDGVWSPALAEIAREDATRGMVEISEADLMLYAVQNKIDLVPTESMASKLARVNVRRREWELPVFVMRRQRPAEVRSPMRPLPPAAAPRISAQLAPASPLPPAPAGLQDQTSQNENSTSISAHLARKGPGVSEKPKGAPMPPIVAGQDDLLERVTGFTGTLTGRVTPEIAGWLLELNTCNRPLIRNSVEGFVAILRSGQWINTGEPVIVSLEGILNDGQHRLTAIVETGISAECDIRFGIAREAFHATGTGRRRNAADILAIAGIRHSHLAAAISRIVYRYDAGTMGDIERPIEPALLLETANETPLIGEVVDIIRLSKFKPAKTAPYGSVLVLAAEATNLETATRFHRLVETGKADDQDATSVLHVRLRDAAMAKTRQRPIEVCVLTARAWNAWIAGRQLSRLLVTEEDRTGAGFPRVLGK